MPVSSMEQSKSLETYTQTEPLKTSFHPAIILFVLLIIKKKRKTRMYQHMLISNLISKA